MPTKETNPLLRAALAYVEKLHWPVFPLKPKSKEPLTEHGYKDATLDEQQIRAWWAKWPKANIGIPTGIHFWALDVDPRHNGDESLAQLVLKHGAMIQDTIRQMTGGGGSQYLYGMPDQYEIGCHTAVWPGIDVKGKGGYIVVPPSIHPSGKPYLWDTAKRSILEESLNPADGWLIQEIMAATKPASPGPAFELPEKILQGARHKTLLRMGGSMRHKGAGYDEILTALWTLNTTRCEPPYDRRHVEKLAQDISKRYQPAASKNGPQLVKGPAPVHSDQAAAIYDTNYPEPEPIVPPILYPGLTILGGRPKVGKSWLSLQLALALVSGEKLAAYLEVKKTCRCLYVSLEDRPRQIRSRLRRLTPNQPYLTRLDFVFELDALMAGGAAQLDRQLTEHPADVVIVDSLLAAIKQAKREHVDIMQADYNIVAILRQIAEKHSLALVLVAHTRKAAGDFLDLIQGTSGTTAAADAVWVLQRTPEGEAALSVTGREVPTQVFGLRHLADEPAWTITGEGDEITQSEARRDILQLLREEGPMKPSKVAARLRKSISGIHRLLNALCDAGLVVRYDYGTYADTETHGRKKDTPPKREEHIQ